MKRQVLGILMILLFLQPLALKAKAFQGEACPNNAISLQHLQSNKQESPSSALENLVLDVEDEDEFFTPENHPKSNDLILANQFNQNKIIYEVSSFNINYYNTQYKSKRNSLYILWSVFRI